MPKVKVRVDDYPDTIRKIKLHLNEKIDKHIERVDNSFAIENYEYVTKQLENPRLKHIYHLLGPLDFFQYKEDADD
jgi:hypothetical protein